MSTRRKSVRWSFCRIVGKACKLRYIYLLPLLQLPIQACARVLDRVARFCLISAGQARCVSVFCIFSLFLDCCCCCRDDRATKRSNKRLDGRECWGQDEQEKKKREEGREREREKGRKERKIERKRKRERKGGKELAWGRWSRCPRFYVIYSDVLDTASSADDDTPARLCKHRKSKKILRYWPVQLQL